MKGSQVRLLSSLMATVFVSSQFFSACQAAPTVQISPTFKTESEKVELGEFRLNTDETFTEQTPILDAATESYMVAQNSVDSQGDPIAIDTPILREAVRATPSNLETRIDNLTLNILLKQIELERYSINYNMQAGKQGRWKGWRYGFFSEVNSSLGLAGGITSIVNRGNALHVPSRVRLRTQEGANVVPMIGNIIGASAAGMEFGINQWHEIDAKRKGYSPKQARNKVAAMKNEINKMLDERDALVRVEASDSSYAERLLIDQAEGEVLRDMRDQRLQQFERFHVAKRKLIAFQQMQYLFDIAKNVTNAIGYDQAYLSLHKHHRIYNGYAGVMFAVSGGLTMVGPVASRAYARFVSEHHRRKVRNIATRTAEDATLSKLKADHARLEVVTRNAKPEKVQTVLNHSAVYSTGVKGFDDEISRSEEASQRAKLVAAQNIGAGAFIGGSKVASGILFIVPGFDSRYNGKGYRADRATNNCLFTSAVVGLPATVFSMADTLRINIRGEIDRQRQLKNGVHPSQLAKTRLKELDELEKTVKADLQMP